MIRGLFFIYGLFHVLSLSGYSHEVGAVPLKTNCFFQCTLNADTIIRCTKSGATALITTQVSGNTGNVSYQWFELNTGLILGAASSSYLASLSPQTGNKTYIVKAIDTIGCTGYDTVHVILVETPVSYLSPLSVGSFSIPATFVSTSISQNANGLLWDFGDVASGTDNYSTVNNASHTYYAWGIYLLKLFTTNKTYYQKLIIE